MSDKKQQINCNIIQDLIPLYVDDVCSRESKEMVEEHIENCLECKETVRKIKDTTYDNCLAEEKEHVLEHHATKMKKSIYKTGVITASILMVPLIVCLICNIAIGHTLDWFFIVLTSLMVFASVTVVPMMVSEKRFLYTIGSFVISLELLLFSVCVLTGGTWFFLASVPIIFGLSVIFMPIVLNQINLPEVLRKQKGLLTMIWDTLWLFAVIFVCGLYSTHEAYWYNAILITLFGLTFFWIPFLVARYLKINKLSKAGIIIVVLGVLSASANNVIAYILKENQIYHLSQADFRVWDNVATVNANVYCIIGGVSIIIGLLLFVSGIIRNKKIVQKNNQ